MGKNMYCKSQKANSKDWNANYGGIFPKKKEAVRPPRIKENKIKCLSCNTILTSYFRHDFKWCKCESIFVDGGMDYLRRGGEGIDNYEELSTYVEETEED